MHCSICGKPPSPYPNWLLSHGEEFHVGCLAKDYRRMRSLVVRLYDAGIVSGVFGPWSEHWTDEDRAMWEKLDDLKAKAERGG